MEFDPRAHPHRRRNPLTGEHVLVSANRSSRPWIGQSEPKSNSSGPSFDPQCYLCPGNKRVTGDQNPKYQDSFVFRNDFPALLPENLTFQPKNSLFECQPASGECRVICFSPHHSLTLGELELDEISKVFQTIQEQFSELDKKYRYVQVFENKGEMMGCSNPHPHAQIWASNFCPTIIEREDRHQFNYAMERGGNLLIEVLEAEISSGERIVEVNDDWVVMVPFWAAWPFETLLLPRSLHLRFSDCQPSVLCSLASIVKNLLNRYDQLFDTQFPYSMGWHQAPNGQENSDHWQLHAHFYPPLLRSATVKKFMVGYEMLAETQRDLTAEQAAERLRACSSPR